MIALRAEIADRVEAGVHRSVTAFEDVVTGQPRGLSRNEFLRTTLETLALSVVFSLMVWGFAEFGVEIGNTKARNALSDPTRSITMFMLGACLIAPIVEEMAFRGLAVLMTAGGAGRAFYWMVGIGVSSLFAAAHGMDMLPLPQLMLGIYTWWLVRHRGFVHAMYAHFVNNVAAVATFAMGLFL